MATSQGSADKVFLGMLGVCFPAAIAAHFFLGGTATFVLCALALVPLARVMGEATEAISHRLGAGLGGLMNASFGNAAELIISIAALRAGDLDVGIAPAHAAPDSFLTEPLSEERVAIALPSSHRLASRRTINLADLADDPWVLVSARIPSRLRDLVVSACAAAGFAPRVAQEARQLDALVALVSAGLGVTFVPNTAERVPRDGVVFRPLRGLDLRFRLVALWPAQRASPALGSFLTVLRAVAR